MIHIIQNDPEVPPGLVEKELDRLGAAWSLVRPDLGEQLPKIEATRAVICLGGSMGANDDHKHPFLTGLKSFIREMVQQDIPYLGICLGGQLLSAALRGVVTSNACGEKGTLAVSLTGAGEEDRLFRGIGREFVSFQWHDDSFSIPEGSVRLAFSKACPNQAFRAGNRAWGLQFHPEADLAIVRSWSSWDRETAVRTEEFVAEYLKHEDGYCEVARKLVENFLKACQ